jgi:hypothetical protein
MRYNYLHSAYIMLSILSNLFFKVYMTMCINTVRMVHHLTESQNQFPADTDE